MLRVKKLIQISIVFSLGLLLSACATGGKRKLQCNLHVINLMNQRKIYLPDRDANGLDRYLRTSPEWKKIAKLPNGRLDHKTAHKYAGSGKVVLATYNTGTKASGHIVMVYGKKGMTWSRGFNSNVPYASGSIQGRKPSITPLSEQFSASKEPKMNYYLYVKK
ncbi:hypothetical protein Dip518_000825 [Parelusimicrobium proximum]|uniref:hypothetical protein n=1 Tax=Parelusimicrobium proximum TaxID=3228953 RepID=UPI003D16EED1